MAERRSSSTYTFSFSLTRSGSGLAPEVPMLEYARVVPTRDLAWLAAALVLFLVEPVVLFWLFHGAGAPQHAASEQASLARAEAAALPEALPAALVYNKEEEVITPLNVRDPSALVIGLESLRPPPPARAGKKAFQNPDY